MVNEASPHFKNRAPPHRGRDVGEAVLTTHKDRNGFQHLVLLHTSDNLKGRVIYLFVKACHMNLLLAQGAVVVGGQASLVRTVMGRER